MIKSKLIKNSQKIMIMNMHNEELANNINNELSNIQNNIIFSNTNDKKNINDQK